METQIEIKLSRPYKRDSGEELTVLKFREPVGRDMRKMDNAKGEFGKLFKLALSTSMDQLTDKDLDALPGIDITQINQRLGEFLYQPGGTSEE